MLVACNPQRDKRTPLDYESSDFNQSGFGFGTANPSTNTNGGIPTTQTPNDSTNPEGFSHCQFDQGEPFRKSQSSLGITDICQNTTNESHILVRFNKSHQTRRVCVVPTTSDSYGNSIYIGNAYCASFTADQFEQLSLVKFDDSYFQSKPLNGVMVLYEDDKSFYESCVQATGIEKEYICNNFTINSHYLYFEFTGY